MAAGLRLLCLLGAVSLVCGDLYLHNPRGSNNRLNERSANRRNANRMFDSQNNNRGGYNAGDVDTGAFTSENQIYYMKYFQSGSTEGEDTTLLIEWTNQHGCGGNQDTDPHKLNCNLVLQYMVQDYDGTSQDVTDTNDAVEFSRLRNGVNTNTQQHNTPGNGETFTNFVQRRQNSVVFNRGLHENMEYYDDCTKRDRNMNLFTADQRLRGESAKYTRQNPNGNRRGYECPEERDYYPYWHPTPWRDIAVLTDNTTLCDMYERESFNVQPRQHCRQNYTTGQARLWSEYNNQEECEENGGRWFTEYGYIDIDTTANSLPLCMSRNNSLPRNYRAVWSHANWAEPDESCLILGPPPECTQVGWSRVNHLGNGRDGVPLNYTWKIPHFLNNGNKLAVIRMRYNISTDDYHPWLTNSSSNDGVQNRSPVEKNPNVDIGASTNKPLRLAINTAQFGRTFQDRSHVMVLRPRSAITSSAQARSSRIHNLNVRGKRGNIVQVYPAVEYDFIPNRLSINTDECIHMQWTGSNTHNNGAPGGDGQTGDAGEGTGGTDRHNIVEIPRPNSNYPLPVDKERSMGAAMFKAADVAWASFDTQNPVNKTNLEVAFASAGYYHCVDPAGTCSAASVEVKTQLNQLLNNAPASFEGALLCFPRPGFYHFISSRNNNFTNRSQKGMLTVRQA